MALGEGGHPMGGGIHGPGQVGEAKMNHSGPALVQCNLIHVAVNLTCAVR